MREDLSLRSYQILLTQEHSHVTILNVSLLGSRLKRILKMIRIFRVVRKKRLQQVKPNNVMIVEEKEKKIQFPTLFFPNYGRKSDYNKQYIISNSDNTFFWENFSTT